MVAEDRMSEILGRQPPAKGLAVALVDEANANGGRDNVTTAVVLRL
jgi:serine/threonine protein phosphatase PrpC